MKTLLLSAVICAATLSLNANAALKSANNFKFVGDTQYAELCQAAVTNDLSLFKKNARQHAFRLSASKNKMMTLLASGDHFQCAGQSLVEFSKSRGSQDIANYLTHSAAKTDSASTEKYKFVGDSGYKNFCKSAVTNSVGLFRRAVNSKIGSLGVSQQEVMDKVLQADNVTCAGKSLSDFIQSREATHVINYITEKSAQ